MRRFLADAAAVVCGALAALVVVGPAQGDPPTSGTEIVAETFTGGSVSDPAWAPSGSTCLTGASAAPPAGAAQIPTCAGQSAGPVPPVGVQPGYLQLTDAANFKAGSILYQRPIPATAGISVVFEQYQYGGSQADGIGFFLVDGATAGSQVGADGGSLGYAQRDNTPGVPGGYLGVGLDSYGNYYDDGEQRGRNCPAGQRSPAGTIDGRVGPNIVTLRGPGNGQDGYCWFAATATGNPVRPTSTLPGSLRGTPGPGNNLTPVRRLVNIQITPAPSPRVVVEIDFTGTGAAWQTVLDEAAPPGTPSTYKFGFLGSTGGSTDVHLIRNVVVTTIQALNELELVKQVSRSGPPLPPLITAGTQIPYQYVVTNAGTETLTGLAVADNTVSTIVCPTTTLPPAPDPAATVVCTGTYTVTSADVSAGFVANVATAAATPPAGPDVVSPPAAVRLPLVSSLSVSKTVSTPGPYSIGQTITYGFTVTNTGGSRLSEVSVVDNRVGAGKAVCAANALDPGNSTACTGTYTVALGDIAAGGSLTNTAFATGVSPIGQAVRSPDTGATITVAADIGLAKSVSDASPTVNDTVTFTVTATNHGPSVAGQVVVTDVVPPGLTLVNAMPSLGLYDANAGTWTIPSLPVNGSQTLRLSTTVDTGASITNGATVTTTQVPDPNPANNSASATLNGRPPAVDLAVTKRASQPEIRVGQSVTFVVAITNNGPANATGVIVDDLVPGTLTTLSATASQGTYNAVTGRWNIGALPVGQTRTLTVLARGEAVSTVLNTAALAASTPVDTNDLNNVDSAAVQIVAPRSDLAVTKTVSPGEAQVGDLVTYVVTAFNNGPDGAHDVVVRELGTAPPGLEIVSVTATAGTFDENALEWTVGTLDSGAPAEILTATVRVTTAGTTGNTVVIEAPGIIDPDPDNNVDSAALVAAALPLDISVTKTAAAPVVQRGQTFVFTVGAVNSGPNAASGLVLRDGLPPGFEFVSAAGPGSFDPVQATWTIGDLAVGATVNLQITARAVVVGSWVNAAALSRVDQNDTDPTNNSADVPVLVDEEADLAITKVVDPGTAQPGDIVTYTVTVTNNGPNDTSNVEAVDPERISADFVSVTLTQGTFDAPTRRWTVGSLSSGQSATLTARIRVDRLGSTVDTVQITQTSTPDPDLTDDTARATLLVPSADVAVSKRSPAGPVTVGGNVTFTVVVTDIGPDPAQGVTVTDPVPPGLALGSATPSTGTYSASTGVWSVGDLDPGEIQTLVIRLTATAAGNAVNRAVAASTGPVDPDPANNAASVGVPVVTAVPPVPDDRGALPATGLVRRLSLVWAVGSTLLGGGILVLVALRRRRVA